MAYEDVLLATVLRLPPRESRVLTCLAWHKNADTGRCFPSIETIARWTMLSTGSVKEATATLAVLELVTKHRGQNSVAYVLNLGVAGEVLEQRLRVLAKPESGSPKSAKPESGHGKARIRPSDSQNLAPNQVKNQINNQDAAPRLVLSMPTAKVDDALNRPDPVEALVERAWAHYIENSGRRLLFSPARRRMAEARAKERLQLPGADMALVEAEVKQAINNLLASEWHRAQGRLDWELIFRSTEKFDDKLARRDERAETVMPRRLTAAEKFRMSA